MNFLYHLPVNLVFGNGVSQKVGEEAARLGKRALIVTGRSSAKKSGLLDRTLELLKKEGVSAVIFDEVEPNPLTTTVGKGAALANEEGCQLVIALGGGSIMDAAKSIAFAAVNEGDITEYMFGRRTGSGALPLILVPTTCGTGSEGNNIAVLTDPTSNDKKGLRGDKTYGAVSLIDPQLMKTMPKRTLASVGFDALCHNMEAYVCKAHTPMSDMIALEGIRRTARSLVRVYEDPACDEAWEDVTLASTLGGMAITAAGVAGPHAIEHPASGLYNITHGLGLAAITPEIFERSISGAPERFAVISRLLGGKDEQDCAGTIRRLLEKLEINVRLRDLGVKEEGIRWMTENCFRVSRGGLSKNPVAFTEADVEAIYRACF